MSDISELEFMECDTCRAKLGSPTLCQGCLSNRSTFYEFKRQVEQLQEQLDSEQFLSHGTLSKLEAYERILDKDTHIHLYLEEVPIPMYTDTLTKEKRDRILQTTGESEDKVELCAHGVNKWECQVFPRCKDKVENT
jgi:hypothetical protein